MRKRIFELEQENEILKRRQLTLPETGNAIEFIEKEKNNHSIERLCRVMKVSEGAFYAWRAGRTYQLGEKKQKLAEKVRAVFYLHRRHYGAKRISVELLATGVEVGRRLASSLMKAQNLAAIRPKRFVPNTTDSAHSFGYSPNLLRDPVNEADGQGQVMVGDITHVPLRGGKRVFSLVFLDHHSAALVVISSSMESTLDDLIGINSNGTGNCNYLVPLLSFER